MTEPKLNNGTLIGMACPKCHSQGPFRVDASLAMDVDDAGSFDLSMADDYNAEIVKESYCLCKACRHVDKVEEFSMEKQYLDSGGHKCPACGGEEFDASGIQVDSGVAWQEVVCACGLSWQDQYKLVGLTFDEDHYSDD
jgi:Zn finger protein HypA/HybF involved in hydrogenase expression